MDNPVNKQAIVIVSRNDKVPTLGCTMCETKISH